MNHAELRIDNAGAEHLAQGQGALRVQSHQEHTFAEIRISGQYGGPSGPEVVITMDANGSRLTVFNPFRHEWAVVQLEPCG